MNCIKVNYGKFSPEIKTKLIEYGKNLFKSDSHSYTVTWKNPNDLQNSKYGQIKVYPVEVTLRREIEEHISKNKENYPNLREKVFGIQVVTGAEHGMIPPHKDPAYYRKKDLVYILDTGGDNVITSWWKLKDPNIDSQLKYYGDPIKKDNISSDGKQDFFSVSEDLIDEVEAHKTEEDSWYMFNFNEIHSVKNIQRYRIAFVTWDQ